LQLFKVLGPDPDDKAHQGKAHAGQNQKHEHGKRVLNGDVHKEKRGDQDDDPNDKRLGRRRPDIADHDLNKAERSREDFEDGADTVALEAVQSENQPLLDKFGRGEIDAPDLPGLLDWNRAISKT